MNPIINQRKNIILFVVVILLLTTGSLYAQKKELVNEIKEYLDTEQEIQVTPYRSYQNKAVLWTNIGSDSIKDWGVVFYNQGKPVDSWQYEGNLRFNSFYPSFHRLIGDGQKELGVVATPVGNKSEQVFIFNRGDSGLKLIYQATSDCEGANYYILEEDSIYNEGTFLDIDSNGTEELILYRKISSNLAKTPYWPDIYIWKDGKFVLSNEEFPNFYIPYFEIFKRAAEFEEQYPMGNHSTFYRYMEMIYKIWDESEGVKKAQFKAMLPPMEMGRKLERVLKPDDMRIYEYSRVNLDGIAPDDSIVYARNPEKEEIWVVTQQDQSADDPIKVDLPQSYYEQVNYKVKKPYLQVIGESSENKSSLTYLYEYTGGQLELRGYQKVSQGDKKAIRKIAGKTLNRSNYGSKEEVIEMALIRAATSNMALNCNGFFSESVWKENSWTLVGSKEFIQKGEEGWQNTQDLSFQINAAHYQKSLYLGLKVIDDHRFYTQESEVEVGHYDSDHLEIIFKKDGKIYKYGIFILPTEAIVVQMGKNQFDGSIKAQWLPIKTGYGVEIKIENPGIDGSFYPASILVVDRDDGETNSVMATSTLLSGNSNELGLIKID